MNIYDLVNRQPPQPWVRWDHLPWNDPEFSRAMLDEHLSQEHDAASRRLETIDRHVQGIHQQVLSGKPGRILDLGCGPGLYLERLARRGHTCTGIDFSPASIEYARAAAQRQGLNITYLLGDMRETEFPEGQDLVMMLYGEFNIFTDEAARQILHKAHTALAPGGRLLLEPSPEEHIRGLGTAARHWHTSPGGLYSPRPHLALFEAFWDEQRRTATERYYIIDAATSAVNEILINYRSYSNDEYAALLVECGFGQVELYPSLPGEGPRSEAMIAVLAVKEQ